MSTAASGISKSPMKRAADYKIDSETPLKKPSGNFKLSMLQMESALERFKMNRNDYSIVDRISKTEVCTFFESNKVPFRYAFIPDPDDNSYGRLIIIEWIRNIHESISLELHILIVNAVGHQYVTGTGSTDFKIGGVVKQADGGLRPRGLVPELNDVMTGTEDGNPFPNIVWEIAYMHEDEEKLIQELLLWISSYTSVQVAIGIKIVDARSRNQNGELVGDVHATVLMFRKNQPGKPQNPITAPYHKTGQLIPQMPPEFKSDFDIQTNLEDKFVSFPLADFYFGADTIPYHFQQAIQAGAMINIRLDMIRNATLDSLPPIR